MNIVVTGHAGRVGQKLTPVLSKLKHVVMGIDLKDGGDMLEFQQGFPVVPDAIIHLAASRGDALQEVRDNIQGTLSMLELAKDTGARFIYAGAYMENVEQSYYLSKRVGAEYTDLMADLHGFQSLVLAIGNVYGPGMDSVINAFIRDWEAYDPDPNGGDPIPRGVTITGDGTQRTDFIYIEDVISALIGALVWEPDYYEVGTGVSTSVFDVFRAMTYIYGYTPKKTFVPKTEPESELNELGCDLKWNPVSLEAGLKLTIDAERRLS